MPRRTRVQRAVRAVLYGHDDLALQHVLELLELPELLAHALDLHDGLVDFVELTEVFVLLGFFADHAESTVIMVVR